MVFANSACVRRNRSEQGQLVRQAEVSGRTSHASNKIELYEQGKAGLVEKRKTQREHEMTLAEVKKILDCEVLQGDKLETTEIITACGCDLMSDVLQFIRPDSLLLTGLTHPQAVRTAEIADVRAICFVRGKKPDGKTTRLAKDKGIWLLATQLPLFESCAKLYNGGLLGCSAS